ncbi:MAG: hypothetical protein AAF902_07505 [Chloroflexota bacterium]
MLLISLTGCASGALQQPEVNLESSATIPPIVENTSVEIGAIEPTTDPVPPVDTRPAGAPSNTYPLPWNYFSNPGGGGAFQTIGYRADGLAIAASDLSGAFINWNVQDQNSRWDVIGVDRGLTATHVSAIGFHPTNSSIIFLGTDSGIFRSDDGAQTFEQVYADGYFHDFGFAPQPDGSVAIYSTYHPQWDSNHGQILRSDDDGVTWSAVSQNLPDDLRLIKLLTHPRQVESVYALSGEARFAAGPAAVYRSTDSGVTWTHIAPDLGEVMDVAFDDQGRLLLTTYEEEPELYGSLYASSDSGESWTFLAQRHGVIWPASNDVIRLIEPRYQFPWDERSGVWESADGGLSWSQISTVETYDFGWSPAYFAHLESYDGPVRTLALQDDVAIWANSQFVFGSFDGGRSFQNVYTSQIAEDRYMSRGIDNIVFFDAAVSEQNAYGVSAIYMAMYDMGCFRSLDGGDSWENCNVPELTGNWEGAGGNSFTVLADPERPEVVWMTQTGDIGDPVSLVRSDNFGAAESWQLSNEGIPETNSITGLAIDPSSTTDSRTLFVAADGNVYRSLDDGWSWEMVFECGGCRFTAVSPHDSTIILSGGDAGLYRSTASGDLGSWAAVHMNEMIGEIKADYWEWGWAGVRDIIFEPSAPGRVFVGVLGPDRGVFLSQDDGQSWEKVLTDSYVRDVHVTPHSIFVASSSAWESGGYDPVGQGVLRSSDGGQTWQQHNEGLPWPFPARFLTLDEAHETLLLAVQGPGFYVTDFR